MQFFKGGLLVAVLLGALGCVDAPPAGGTAGTALYVYDNVSGDVRVWDDVNALYDSVHPPEPTRTLGAGTIRNCRPLWGGLAMDAGTDCLYLVPATGGRVVRVSRASTQNEPKLKSKALDTFHLGEAGDRFPGGSLFGPASVNPQTGILYVTESSADRRRMRVWAVPDAAKAADDSTIPKTAALTPLSSDRGFAAVVGGQGGDVYGFFPNGNTVKNLLGTDEYEGPRLRAGTKAAGFEKHKRVLIGPATRMEDPDAGSTYGSLAFDPLQRLLFVSRQATSASVPAVLVFETGQLGGNFDQAPKHHLKDTAAALPYLRFLSHAARKDWLVGADWLPANKPPKTEDGKGGAGTAKLHLWKSPSSGGTATTVTLGGGIQVGGVALDGSH